MTKQIMYFSIGIVLFFSTPALAQTATDVACSGCVGAVDIANNAVTSPKIQNNSVTTAKISDGTITNADISSTAAIDASKISGTAWTSSNDGSGTGLDADTLDGIDSSQFLQSGENITVDGSGNVGIGTTSPEHNLEIYGTDARAFVHYYGYSRGGIQALDSQRIGLVTTVSDDDLVFGYTDNTPTSSDFVEYMRIDNSSGNVGIGTTDPVRDLHLVSPSVSSELVMEVSEGTTDKRKWNFVVDGGSGNPQNFSIRQLNDAGTGGDTRLLINGASGNVGIGTSSPSYKLDISGGTGTAMRIAGGGDLQIDAQVSGGNSILYNDYGALEVSTGMRVEGTLQARELYVLEGSWMDFVFKEDYPLKSLAEVESFIQQNKHLPDIPSESEVLENGVSVGDMQKRLLQKVEELTLYVIAQDKKIAELERGGK